MNYRQRFIHTSTRVLPALAASGLMIATLGATGCADDGATDTETGGDSDWPGSASGSTGTGNATLTASASGGDTTGTTSGGTETLPDTTGDVPVCPGPDVHEDNDENATAKEVLVVDGKGSTRAGISKGDDDVFRFVVPKTDPVIVGGSYTVVPGDTTDLSVYVYGAGGREVVRDAQPRADLTEVLAARFIPEAPNSQYFVKYTSSGDACQPYDISIDAVSCTDVYEDNESLEAATALTVPPGASTVPDPTTITDNDDDVYTFTVAGTDPTNVSVNYSVLAGDSTDLSIYIYNASGREITRNAEPRTELTETAVATWRPEAPGSSFFVKVTSSQPTCTNYTLGFDTMTCHDNFEDNDDFLGVKPLAAGSNAAKITKVDEDWYQIQSPATEGSCTVTYTAATGSAQDLSIYLYDATERELMRDANPRTGPTEAAVVSWNGDKVPFGLRVRASEDECIDYTIVCQ